MGAELKGLVRVVHDSCWPRRGANAIYTLFSARGALCQLVLRGRHNEWLGRVGVLGKEGVSVRVSRNARPAGIRR